MIAWNTEYLLSETSVEHELWLRWHPKPTAINLPPWISQLGSAEPDKLSKAGLLFLSLNFLSPLAYRGSSQKFLKNSYSCCQALLPVLNEANQPINFLVSSYFSFSVLSYVFRLSEKLEAQIRTCCSWIKSVSKFTQIPTAYVCGGLKKKLLSTLWRFIYMWPLRDTWVFLVLRAFGWAFYVLLTKLFSVIDTDSMR